MNIDTKLRNLAKTNYWQNLYKSSQKCSGIRLFKNSSNFSGLQVRFLYWLSVYELLFTELSTYEDDLLSEAVLADEVRTDAYLIHRNKKQDYLWRKHRDEEKQAQIKANRKKSFKNPGKESLINVDLRRE
jgi:hypothetical protein